MQHHANWALPFPIARSLVPPRIKKAPVTGSLPDRLPAGDTDNERKEEPDFAQAQANLLQVPQQLEFVYHFLRPIIWR